MHNIFYPEYRLQEIGKSNCECHFGKNEKDSLMHLFYICHKIKHVLDELKRMFNIIFENNIVLVEENIILVVYEGEITADLLLVNLIICILKWGAWKTGNYIKYNKRINRETIASVAHVCTFFIAFYIMISHTSYHGVSSVISKTCVYFNHCI